MTAMGMAAMDDDAPRLATRIGQVALLGGAGLGLMFCAGLAVGLATARLESGNGIDARFVALLAGTTLLAMACLYAIWRATRAMARESGGATTRERRSRVIFVACAGIGAIVGVALSLSGTPPLGAFSSDPLPAGLAIALAITVAVLLPILSVYWHRRVADEQEAAAYAKGALIGIYAYWIGAPTWWLLWRGGLVPAPDGILIYFVTIAVTGLVWLWAKYR